MAITPAWALSTGAMWAVLSLALPVEAQEGLTPCQRCCMPGGDCSKAFKGAPGKCCGTISGHSFCCPGTAGLSGSKCYNCGSTYRCFTGNSARNVCGHQGSAFTRMKPVEYRGIGANGGEVFILFVIVAVGIVLYCSRTRPQFEEYGPAMGPAMGYHAASPAYKSPVANGVPLNASGMQMPAPNAYPQQMPMCAPAGGCYAYGPQASGYSGTAMAGSAAAGFVGGMLVSDMMHHNHQDHEVHHHYHEDEYGGFGGAGYGGGYCGESCGDDGGFEADS